MASTDPKHIKTKTNRRSRKKRRTTDFSDSSSSDSSSSSSSPSSSDEEELQHQDILPNEDIDMKDASEETLPQKKEELSVETQKQLSDVNFTTNQQNMANEKQELDKKFLQLMASQHGDDLDELRKKTDFNEKSLAILIQTLQSGRNIFDKQELDELFK